MNGRMKGSIRLLGWVAAAVLVLAVAPSRGLAAADAWLTAKTKMALMTSDDAPATDVNVDTVEGVVTLHGKVETPEQKAQAAKIAKDVAGVRDVRNLLQVVPAASQDRVEVADEQIRDRVVEALESAPQLDGSDVDVESVNQGVVLLSGKAESYGDALAAVSATARVPGVRKVASEIESPDRLTANEPPARTARTARSDAGDTDRDAGIGESAANAAADAGNAIARTAGQAAGAVGDAATGAMDAVTGTTRSGSDQVSDMWITSEAKLRLMADDEAPALDVNVDTENGMVTLFGMVGSAAEKQAAEAAVKEVDGVKGVKNELQVVSRERQEQVEATDGEVQNAVEAKLDKRDGLGDVSVDVKNGVVRLSGEVPSQADRVTAAVAARSTPGVKSVHADDLKLEARG